MAIAVNIGHASSREPEVMIDINTTPLIDVLLVLLVMLIITIPVQLHAVNLNMPVGQPPPLEPPQVVTIDIDSNGTVYWNGEVIPERAKLEERLAQAAAMPVQPEVHLRPNQRAQYKDVAAVMASAQRHGVVKLGLVGHEQFLR
ncbi:MAG: biopolymer transporter ExbD [Sutterellaceae bacterium]|nr:biopolymer transporter ExbD [Burkholderiaceae bacterium]MDW8429859.1 biopolymer transporter ExbD [Sutterellaceae bacterium]